MEQLTTLAPVLNMVSELNKLVPNDNVDMFTHSMKTGNSGNAVSVEVNMSFHYFNNFLLFTLIYTQYGYRLIYNINGNKTSLISHTYMEYKKDIEKLQLELFQLYMEQ